MKNENCKTVRLGDVCENQAEETLFKNIAKLIEDSRKQVAKAVNTAMVYTYYRVGQYIVEYEPSRIRKGNFEKSFGSAY